MKSAKQGSAEERLEQLESRIDAWRQTRGRYSRMPRAYWDEATALSHELGVSPVQHRLGINHEALRRRVDPENADVRVEAPEFVELARAPMAAADPSGPVVELEDASGWRLTIRLAQGADLDVARVVGAFRGAR